jgi:hypothetical protein
MHRACREVRRDRLDPMPELVELPPDLEQLLADPAVWPTACECGEPVPADRGGLWYRGPSAGRLWDTPSGRLEPGCIYEATWLRPKRWLEPGQDSYLSAEYWDACRAAGRILVPLAAVCPDGRHWVLHAHASNGTRRPDGLITGWSVTGEPPRITARPSIVTGSYHGWLTDGVFSDPI